MNKSEKEMKPGKRVGYILEKLDISQSQLAEECNVSPQYINNIIRRDQRITQEFAQNLGEKRGLNLNWLFTGDGPLFIEEYKNAKPVGKSKLAPLEQSLRVAAQKFCQIADLLSKFPD